MSAAVYNSAIPDLCLNTVNRASRPALHFRLLQVLVVLCATSLPAHATDWSRPEQELAKKILAATGPGAVELTIENHSSLGRRESEIVANGLRSALGNQGLHFVAQDQSAATVRITLSENPTAYVWVAEIRQSAGDVAVVIASMPRTESVSIPGEAMPMSLRKIPLWTQDDPILDVAVLEESTVATHSAVLSPEAVTLYRLQNGKWQPEQAFNIVHARPWPRDLRGRLITGGDRWLEVYLPGVFCAGATTATLSLNCHGSDDPWPLTSVARNNSTSTDTAGLVPQTKAFFAPTRNFFTGALNPGIGKFTNVSKFYSAAYLPRERYVLWIFAATDGNIHLVDGVSDQTLRIAWGSNLTSLRTDCGAGWQVLATSSGDQGDSIRAYEFPDRDPVAVSGAVDLPGTVTALWTDSRSNNAVVVAKNRETGAYEAFRLALACGQ